MRFGEVAGEGYLAVLGLTLNGKGGNAYKAFAAICRSVVAPPNTIIGGWTGMSQPIFNEPAFITGEEILTYNTSR